LNRLSGFSGVHRRVGVPIVFLHLPVQAELAAGRPLPVGAAATIWSTIERDFETKIATYFDLKRKPALPSVYNLEPLDGHPSAAGIGFYAVRETDPAKQRAKMREFETYALDTQVDTIMTPWWSRIITHRSYMKGWKISPSHYLNLNLANIWLDK
jgi:hypothetical protein